MSHVTGASVHSYFASGAPSATNSVETAQSCFAARTAFTQFSCSGTAALYASGFLNAVAVSSLLFASYCCSSASSGIAYHSRYAVLPASALLSFSVTFVPRFTVTRVITSVSVSTVSERFFGIVYVTVSAVSPLASGRHRQTATSVSSRQIAFFIFPVSFLSDAVRTPRPNPCGKRLYGICVEGALKPRL